VDTIFFVRLNLGSARLYLVKEIWIVPHPPVHVLRGVEPVFAGRQIAE